MHKFKGLAALVMLALFGVAVAADLRTEKNTLVSVFGVPQATVNVSASTTSARTSADFGREYEWVELYCTTDAFFKFTTSAGTAATTDVPLPAKTPRVYNSGASPRIAFILSAGTATCSVTPLR